MNRRVVMSLVVLTAISAGVAFTLRPRGPAPVSGPAVATVNGTAITRKQLDIRVAELLPMASYHGSIPPEKLASLRRAALDELILDELVWQDASARGRHAPTAAVDAEVERVRRRFESEAEFQFALRDDGVTLDAFRRYMARRVVVREERQQRSVVHNPTEAEITRYYETNGAEFLRPEQRRLLEILVKVDPVGTEEDERRAKAKADAALARLRQGEPFEAVARETSDDAFATKGGDLGWVHSGRLDRDLEGAAFATPVGQLGQVRSISGFHVYKVVGREPARQLTLDEARPLIIERVQRARRDATRQAWEEGLRASARIEILDPVLREASPTKLPTVKGAPAASVGAARASR